MDSQFEIRKRKKGDVALLDLYGNLTVGENEQLLKDTVADLISREHTKMVVNLANVEFVDSSGIGALVKGYTSATNAGGRLKLLSPGKMVRQTLRLTGLLGIFEIFEDESAALASF
jgi:anti-sigma B factor antagonist